MSEDKSKKCVWEEKLSEKKRKERTAKDMEHRSGRNLEENLTVKKVEENSEPQRQYMVKDTAILLLHPMGVYCILK